MADTPPPAPAKKLPPTPEYLAQLRRLFALHGLSLRKKPRNDSWLVVSRATRKALLGTRGTPISFTFTRPIEWYLDWLKEGGT